MAPAQPLDLLPALMAARAPGGPQALSLASSLQLTCSLKIPTRNGCAKVCQFGSAAMSASLPASGFPDDVESRHLRQISLCDLPASNHKKGGASSQAQLERCNSARFRTQAERRELHCSWWPLELPQPLGSGVPHQHLYCLPAKRK
ncbi:hypothetical protein C2845_PM11G05350 [Panicum miliaceum]|uniref:Uncharacterized protein n=1 Tax=Panicum miliaceum TaxID=4540 RepID=A0A3L6RPC9_PANMI|nr:hypothetical protein C2845_PM11G05350 [Panicum miliaceum]